MKEEKEDEFGKWLYHYMLVIVLPLSLECGEEKMFSELYRASGRFAGQPVCRCVPPLICLNVLFVLARQMSFNDEMLEKQTGKMIGHDLDFG